MSHPIPTAVVTGASRGFGRAIAAALVAAGTRVVGIARNDQDLRAVRNELGEGFTLVAADATDEALAHDVIREHRPGLLVLNAGAAPHMAPVHEQTWESFSRNWNTDTRHAFAWTRAALREPLAPGSVVVAMLSDSWPVTSCATGTSGTWCRPAPTGSPPSSSGGARTLFAVYPGDAMPGRRADHQSGSGPTDVPFGRCPVLTPVGRGVMVAVAVRRHRGRPALPAHAPVRSISGRGHRGERNISRPRSRLVSRSCAATRLFGSHSCWAVCDGTVDGRPSRRTHLFALFPAGGTGASGSPVGPGAD
jgi:hypothetical protein